MKDYGTKKMVEGEFLSHSALLSSSDCSREKGNKLRPSTDLGTSTNLNL